MFTYEISATERIAITETCDATFDGILGDGIGLVWLNSDGFKEYAPYDKTSDYYAVNFIPSDYYRAFSYKRTRLNAYARYLRLAQNGMNARRISLQGYTQSDWAEAIVYGTFTDEQLAAVVSEVRLWWSGEVYDLQAQTLKVFTAPDGERLELWRNIEDTLQSGYLIEYGQISEDLARDYWRDVAWAMA